MKAYKSEKVNPSGKRSFVFSAHKSHSGIVQNLPCGKCIGCRLDHASSWAVRCVHESKLHEDNCFITLTYNDDTLPENGTLVLADLQKFLKRLRAWYSRVHSRRVRFYACGEYGDTLKRAHYHALLFGLRFEDQVYYGKSKSGQDVYTSAQLTALWEKGNAYVGAMTYETANYVAQYCLKKVDGEQRHKKGHYLVLTSDGVVFERLPEFSTMSRRPGIASGYYAKFGHEIRAHDSIIIKGKVAPSIRYYDKLYEIHDPSGFEKTKRARQPSTIAEFKTRAIESRPDRLFVKEYIREQSSKQSGRNKL